MLTVVFDTLRLARKLEGAGFSPKQAQDTSIALAESFSEWQVSLNLATRDDLKSVRDDLKNVRDDIVKDITRLESSQQRMEAVLRQEIAETKAEILKWMFGAIAVQTLAIIGAIIGLLHNSGRM